MRTKKFLLMSAMLLITGGACAQQDGELISLLPDGVTTNINPERKQDKQKNMIVVGSKANGYKAFFAATDAEHGEELWVTDGTPAGTHMVKDIVAGTGGSNPSYLGRLGDKALFSANDGESGQETWVSDGTEAGTFMLIDSYTFGDGDPRAFTQMDETRAIFACVDDESAEYDPDHGPQRWLYITDGTVAGTKRVVENADVDHQPNMKWPGQDNTTLHTAYVRVGRRVFFKADKINGSTGEELWVTDGTTAGTFECMDINWERWPEGQWGYTEGYTRSCGLDNLENYNNERVFFQAWTPDYGSEPWTSDGALAEGANGSGQSGTDHTYMVYDVHPGQNANGIGFSSGTFGTGWEVYKDRIWYRGWTEAGGFEFAGTNLQKGDYQFFDVWSEEPSAQHNSYSDPGCVFDGVYMFCAAEGFDASRTDNYGGEMHCFDGTKTWLQYDFCPGTMSDWIKEQTVAGGSMYWMNEANNVAQGFGTGLYRLDSKDGVPVVCTHIDSNGDFVNTLRNLNGTIIFNSDATDKVYVYKYTKPNWDGVSDYGYTDPVFDSTTKVESIKNATPTDGRVNVFNAAGMQVRKNVKIENATNGLQKGIYVVGKNKVVVD